MRLLVILDSGSVVFTKDLPEHDLPPFTILSHTWGSDDDEVSYHDINRGTARDKAAWCKIDFCIKQTQRDGFRHFWMDTCCIDKGSSAELGKSIRSMFRWYSRAQKCYVYLSDITYSIQPGTPILALVRHCRWFTRGWTLQELLAPVVLEFYSQDGTSLGTKHSLIETLHTITGIPSNALRSRALGSFPHRERLAWLEGRTTRVAEDIVYCMFGILDLNIAVRYGEGKENAKARLERKLQKLEGVEHSIFSSSPEDKPTPMAHLPFRRDHQFVKRKELDILDSMTVAGAKVALVGLGGIGKSQLAIEHCYALKERSPNIWVFWVHCNTAARFDQSIRKLANDAKLEVKDNDDADLFQNVQHWLSDDKRQWLLVLDNADDARFLFEPPATDLGQTARRTSLPQTPRHEFIPACNHGRIVFTTRDKSAAWIYGVTDEHIINVQADKEVAIKLINSRLGHLTNPETSSHLADKLDHIPLAIAQASAYIRNRQGRCTPTEYINLLDKSDDIKAAMLSEDREELTFRRDVRDASNSVIKSWHLSFEHIYATQRSAAKLLSLMSFYNFQGIPESLLRPSTETVFQKISVGEAATTRAVDSGVYTENVDSRGKVSMDSTVPSYSASSFEEDLQVPRTWSFVEMTSSRSFEMHRLVQLATQAWLKARNQHQMWQAESLRRLAAAFPRYGSYGCWAQCRMLYPHARLAQHFHVEGHESLAAKASVLHIAAWYANEKEAYEEAKQMIAQSLKIFHHLYGEKHRDTLASMSEQAWTFWNLKEWEKAEELQVKIPMTRNTLLGRRHPATLLSMSKLALLLRHSDRLDEARRLETHSRSKANMSATVQHSARLSTLSGINSLELTFWGQGQWKEAEELQRTVFDSCKDVLGVDHPDTLMAMSHLAATYLDQKRFAEAFDLLGRCVVMQALKLGAEHPQTLDSQARLRDVRMQLPRGDVEPALARLGIE